MHEAMRVIDRSSGSAEQSWQPRLSTVCLSILWAAMFLVTPATAQSRRDFANVQTQARQTPLFSASVEIPACTSSLQNGLINESSMRTCNAGPSGSNAAIELVGSASGPTGTCSTTNANCSLMALKAKARIDLTQGNAPTNTEILGFSLASFRDYIQLGAQRPDHMTFDFILSGNLSLLDASASTAFDRLAKVLFHFYGQSGIWGGAVAGGNSGFGSIVPYGGGQVTFQRSIYHFGTTDGSDPGSSQVTSDPNSGMNPADIQFAVLTPGTYRLTLGPSFFNNSRNNYLLFDLSLSLDVRLGASNIPSNLFSLADFTNGFRLTSVHAFDAGNNDITATAFTGFESAKLPASITISPTSSSIASGGNQAYTVQAFDQSNNPLGDVSSSAAFSIVPDGSCVGATCSATLAGPHTVTAAYGGKTATASLDVTSGPSGVTHFLITAPASVSAGSPFTFTVTAKDSSNNTITGYTGTVQFSSTDGSAVLPANSTLVNGTNSFSATLKTAGNQTITAKDTTLPATASNSNSILVNPSVAVRLEFSGLQSSYSAGALINFTLTARDTFGNLATGYTGSVKLESGIATRCCSPNFAGGIVQYSMALVSAGPGQVITATDTLNSSIKGDSPPINVLAGPATHFSFLAGQVTTTGGAKYTFRVLALDQFNNFQANYSGTVHLTSNDPNALLPADSVLNGSGFFDVILNTSGSRTVTVTDIAAPSVKGDLSLTVIGSAAPTPTGDNVVTQPLDPATGAPQPITLTFPHVSSDGGTTAVPVTLAPPANFSLNGTLYDIVTTASYTPPITICFLGSTSGTIFHYVNGVPVQLVTQSFTNPNRLCADTNTLSPFGVFTPVNSNHPPSASAGSSQTVEATSAAGATVGLSGSGSDPDGDSLSYAWTGPCGPASGANVSVGCPLGVSTMTLTVDDGHGGTATSTVDITVRDTTPPSVQCSSPDILWHAMDVSIACSASDLVGLLNPADANFSLTTSVPAGTETASASTGSRSVCDKANNCATAGPVGPIKIDKKAPAIIITRPVEGAVYALNQQTTASFSCSDGGSGNGSCSGTVANGASMDTASTGSKTFTVTADDAVGNHAERSVTYTVTTAGPTTFAFEGFFAPVDISTPAVVIWNTVKAGQGVPIKWRLTLNGSAVSDPASFVDLISYPTACSSGVTSFEEIIDETATGKSGLQYGGDGYWQFNWKTLNAYAGSCRTILVKFSDGTTSPIANFKFK